MSAGQQGRDDHRSRAWDVNEDAMSPASKTKSSQRGPPPALFLHPSPGASHVSLPGILAPGAPAPGPSSLKRQRSNLDGNGSLRLGRSVPPEPPRPGRSLRATERTRSSADKTDALWAEMQATLEEVELSASGGTHVFGPEHDRKLVELRTAQIALAQAWARSEADDAIETTFRDNAASAGGEELRNMKGVLSDVPKAGVGDGTDAPKSTTASTSIRPGSSGGEVERLGAKLEEETEVDILLARKRREANDQYFKRVNSGVIDVVAKLGDVAVAMRAVEQESRDVWNEDEPRPASSRT